MNRGGSANNVSGGVGLSASATMSQLAQVASTVQKNQDSSRARASTKSALSLFKERNAPTTKHFKNPEKEEEFVSMMASFMILGLEQILIVACQGVVQLGRSGTGLSLRLRLVSLFYSLRVPLEF